ncbi:MAG: Stp1/IreP family PP2C-type Ser/Thr phosphatase [Actinobacteria bacterium]|nr:Stp1/IreP family PP2C-type Ser/Thr phosphatase [Actinomycetota bacterium]
MTLHRHALAVRAFGATHTGRVRTGNEDSFLMGDAVFAVADGMGGHQAGEIASDAALEPLRDIDLLDVTGPADIGDLLATAVREANTLVVERAAQDPQLEGMGTTLTAVAIREGQLHVAHVGDSRAYLLRDEEQISQLTTDHTLVERLVQEGRLSRDEAATHPQRNVITRAIGHESTVEIEVLPPITLRDGDQILLCSDGLSGPVTDERIASTLYSTPDGDEAVATLLAHANEAGGPDNITAVLVRVGARWAHATAATAATAATSDDTSASDDAGAKDTQQLATQPDEPPDSTARTDPSGTTGSDASPDARRQISIDTSPPTSDEPWATRLGRIGAARRADRTTDRTRRLPVARIAAALLVVLVLAGLLLGGGWLLLSRSYFVGAHEGVVAIYRGVPQPILGVSAARVVPTEITTTRIEEFPAFRQQSITDGLPAQSLDDARRIVEDLQSQLQQSQPSSDVGDPLIEPSESLRR